MTMTFRSPYLVKTDALGNILWQKTDFGYYEERNIFTHIVQQGDYYYLSAGIEIEYDDLDTGNMLLLKIDGDGNILWEKVLTFRALDFIASFLMTPDKEFFCTGQMNGDVAIFKLDSLGDVVWQNTTIYTDCEATSPLLLADTSIVTTGCSFTNIPAEAAQMQMVKFSNDDEILWKRTYGNEGGNDYGYDMIFMDGDETGKSGYVVTGRTENDTAALVYLVRTNCMGLVTELLQTQFTLTKPEADNPYLIALPNNSLYTYSGETDGGRYYWDFGDGHKIDTQSHDEIIEYTYAEDGAYTVTLTALVCNDTSRLSKTVCINTNPLPANITYTLHFHADHPNAPDSVLWELSNGTTSTNPSLTQTLNPDTEGSSITVTLTTYICQDTLTTTRIIDLWAVGIGEKEGNEMAYFISELHPNPAQTVVYLEHQFQTGLKASFDLYDLNGKLLKQVILEGNSTLSLNTSQLSEGMYFYQIRLSNEVVKRAKLVVTK